MARPLQFPPLRPGLTRAARNAAQGDAEATLQRINAHKARRAPHARSRCRLLQSADHACSVVPFAPAPAARSVAFRAAQGVHATILLNREGEAVRSNAEVRAVNAAP